LKDKNQTNKVERNELEVLLFAILIIIVASKIFPWDFKD